MDVFRDELLDAIGRRFLVPRAIGIRKQRNVLPEHSSNQACPGEVILVADFDFEVANVPTFATFVSTENRCHRSDPPAAIGPPPPL